MTEPIGREGAQRFLLAEMADEERDAVEERFFTQDDAFAEAEEAEDDLADAYGRGRLSPERRAAFESRYLQDEAGRRRVMFARALAALLAGRRRRQRTRTWGAWAAAGLAALALAGALTDLDRVRSATVRLEREQGELARATAQHEDRARGLAAEVERLQSCIAELQAALVPDLASVAVLTLTPGLVRDTEPLPTVGIGPEASHIELTLRLTDDPYPSYGVAVETPSGLRVWTGRTSSRYLSGGRALRVSLPSRALAPGHYLATVVGIQPGHPATSHADYVFRVMRRPPAAPRH